MASNSRAEYFRERRKVKKQIVFMIDRDLGERLDQKLAERGIGRTEWFVQVVREELSEKE